jgi:hypothetical protein
MTLKKENITTTQYREEQWNKFINSEHGKNLAAKFKAMGFRKNDVEDIMKKIFAVRMKARAHSLLKAIFKAK